MHIQEKLCGTSLLDTAHCLLMYCIALYCTVLHGTTLHYITLNCTKLKCSVMYCTVVHCTALPAGVLFNQKNLLENYQKFSNFSLNIYCAKSGK